MEKRASGKKRSEPATTGSDLDRRDFLRLASAGAALLIVRPAEMAAALPAVAAGFEHLVPGDKGLSKEWIAALSARGEPERFTKAKGEFRYIGMPIGGLFAGHLYLGGDGRLWHWDILNEYIYTADRGPKVHYDHPMEVDSPIVQRFTLALGDKRIALDQTGFADVSFRGEYPLGIVEYADPGLPLNAKLEAFSPFTPLNVEDSSLPVTVLRFTVRNHSDASVTATLTGELENAVCVHHRNIAGVLRNRRKPAPGLNQIVFSAEPAAGAVRKGTADWLESLSDYGTMSLALLGEPAETSGDASAPFGEKLIGLLGRKLELQAGESREVTFLIAWHFPNLSIHDSFADCGRSYAARFSSAPQVAEYVAANFERLAGQTRLWRDTWYESSLPYWFLDRTFLNTSILATSTSYRLADGRYYGWEGVGNCQGTCGHVYQYAHATARLFPEMERDLHERVDFGLAQMPDGAIHFRGEFNDIPAIDAQSGYVLRALREHQMSVDDAFLRRNWPRVRLAMEWLIRKDADGDGLIESNQHNTLDTDWYGKVAWLSGLYLAALAAAAEMADDLEDAAFAAKCRAILDAGRKNFVEQLFDGEYFINRVETNHLDAINSGTGCEIDQVMGQSWAFQVGLPRIFPKKETLSALRSLWRYNFTPDVGPYREVHKPGRWYAMPGEAGLLMCTFPRDDWDYRRASGKGPEWAVGYFNECMNGFEYQVAGHMIREGMVTEGLAIVRALHERYHPGKRNPWNEIECGDHYARSMASYGVFLAACGFEYHGPRKHIGFAPRLSPEDFRCAFTSAEGWGSYAQSIVDRKLRAEIEMRWGKLQVRTIALKADQGETVHVTRDATAVPAEMVRVDGRVTIRLHETVELAAGQKMMLVIS